MITRSLTTLEPKYWQKQLAEAISDPDELIHLLKLDKNLSQSAHIAAESFPLRVTRHYLSLIEPGNPQDPLLRQILPISEEMQILPGFKLDPVGDHQASEGASILQKYTGRALLITTGACAIHCRYCFRRHYPYSENNSIRHWPQMLEKLQQMKEIDEVILSGGDPLSLSDERLIELIQQIEAMPHIQRLRIHSRLPLVLPDRITPLLITALAKSRLHTSLVLHCNHPNELDKSLADKLQALRAAGVTLLNQSVLLRGVNDKLSTLKALSEKLFVYGVLPYYLHLLDPVQGAAHFEIDHEQAQRLQEQLRNTLPGYLMPRMVREIPAAASKTPIHRL